MEEPDNINEQLDDAPEMDASDMEELFEGIDEDSPGSGDSEESAPGENTGQGDSDRGADSEPNSEDESEQESEESDKSEEDDSDSETDDETESEESEEDSDDSGDDENESESSDEPDDDEPDVDEDSVAKANEFYESSRESAILDVAKEFAPAAQAAKQAKEKAEAELAEIEKRYSEPDEDGYVRETLTLADQRRVVQLENQIADANRSWNQITTQLGQKAELAERELMIQTNLKAFPKLANVEPGFREALQRGYKFSSPAEAVEISAALMRAKGKAPAAAKPEAPKPKAGELEKAALEASISKKKAGAMTAGRGSSGSKGASAKSNPYKGLSHTERDLMKYFDNAFPEGR